ncbi:MAG: anhydro-N-acetylmuramic acid kinase [Sphingobacteriaceae bacterium]|nr:MAG: anhydro-N-acetylmuramic acid kinase [Pedobacter sp.]
MNKSLNKLMRIASQTERKIIGLMSGTSLDGLDIALCVCRGTGTNTQLQLVHFQTINYDNTFKSELKNICFKRDVDLQKVCLLHAWIGLKHADMILSALKHWNVSPSEVDLIASHGQTVFHAPRRLHGLKNYPNSTLQLGDGDHIAAKTGIITLCDFRQKHVAVGGQGAPLAVYGDYILFANSEENRVLLNIGGISNLTYLPASKDAHKVFSTDIGPGNTLMDHYVQQHYPGLYFDKDAMLAQTGDINQLLLAELLGHSFFKEPFPKTTGPELFNLTYLIHAQERSGTMHLKPEEVLATLAAFSAQAIILALKICLKHAAHLHIYLSGGGVHHPLLMQQIQCAFPLIQFRTTAELGISPDAKEAVLFAILANECMAKTPIDFGPQWGIPSICMGKVCLP